MIKLIGVVIIVAGLALKFNTLLVIMIAAVATGFVADMDGLTILGAIGEAFTSSRYISLFILVLPMFGLLERYGLKEKAEQIVRGLKAATAGRVFLLYMLFRQVSVAFGMHLNGHPTMIRPVIAPMGEGAAAKNGRLSPALVDYIKGMAASCENYGNFFGQLGFIAASGLLLIKGFMDQSGHEVDLIKMATYALPTAVAAYLIAIVRFHMMDRRIRREAIKEEKEQAHEVPNS